MRRNAISLLAAAALALPAAAQLFPVSPDWKELDAPAPPAFRTDKLIAVDVRGSALKFGVDPATLTVGTDDIVRYVVVASSDSTVNAMYEAIRCKTAEVKLYARHTPGGGWTQPQEVEWRPLYGNSAQRHSLSIARMGACQENAPRSASVILRDMRSPVDTRFNNESRR